MSEGICWGTMETLHLVKAILKYHPCKIGVRIDARGMLQVTELAQQYLPPRTVVSWSPIEDTCIRGRPNWVVTVCPFGFQGADDLLVKLL